MSVKIGSLCDVLMERRLEVWRPVKNLTPQQKAKQIRLFPDRGFLGRLLRRKIPKALIDVDVAEIGLDLVVDGGLNDLCAKGFGTQTAVFNYVAIGTDGTTPSNTQTALLAEVMRVSGTYAKDAGVGECSMDATFDITVTYALQECGLLNAVTAGTMYCRDIYTTKNVESGDTVKVYYTPKFQRPA